MLSSTSLTQLSCSLFQSSSTDLELTRNVLVPQESLSHGAGGIRRRANFCRVMELKRVRLLFGLIPRSCLRFTTWIPSEVPWADYWLALPLALNFIASGECFDGVRTLGLPPLQSGSMVVRQLRVTTLSCGASIIEIWFMSWTVW